MSLYTFFYVFSFLAFPLVFFILSSKCKKWKKTIFLGIILLFIFGHFIEPKSLVVKKVKLETGFSSNFLVVGSIDARYFKDENKTKSLVQTLNSFNGDFLLFVGDIDSKFDKSINLKSVLAPLKNLNTPSFYVKEDKNTILAETLASVGVTNILGLIPKINDINIIGFTKNETKSSKSEYFKRFSKEDNIIVMLESPDDIFDLPGDLADISLSRAEGKKLRIPFTNSYIFPSNGPLENGLYEAENGRILLTTGLDSGKFPFRLFNPPEIINIETF